MHASDKPAETPGDPSSRARFNGSSGIAQFGPFELSLDTGELRKHGIRIRMQAKPLAILLALLEKPGAVVTREQLHGRLWAADTFVDFESGLNTAANRLRIGLGDSADMPRYVETLPRVGYRFIAPVSLLVSAPQEAVPRPAVYADASTALLAEIDPEIPPPVRGRKLRRRTALLIAVASLVAAALAGRYLLFPRQGARPPEFHQLTFQNGWIGNARFSQDANTVIYSRWVGGRQEVDLVDTASPESRRLPLPPGALAAVSRSGELAIVTMSGAMVPQGSVLSRAPLNGGSPRVVAAGASCADWSPRGDDLALLIARDNGDAIEYPKGHVLFQSSDLITSMRFSPSGDYIAFLSHPLRQDDAGVVRVVDMKGNARTLTRSWASAMGLAWAPSGREVWFTAAETGSDRALRAVTLDGRDRVIARAPGVLRLLDIARDGRVLLARDDTQATMLGRLPGDAREKDLTWFDLSHIEDISASGNLVLFTEAGEASGPHYRAYVHDQKANTTTRIGTGRALSLSPDASHVLALDLADRRYLTAIALGADQPRRIYGHGLLYQWARFMPDGRTLLAAGAYPQQPLHLYLQTVSGGNPAPVRTGAYIDSFVISPDGVHVAGLTAERRPVIVTLGTDALRTLPVDSESVPAGWTADGRGLYLANVSAPQAKLMLLNIATGETRTVRTFTAVNSLGDTVVSNMVVTPNGEYYVYSLDHLASQVFSLDGVSG